MEGSVLSALAPTSNDNLVQAAYAALEDAIVSGRLLPGEFLSTVAISKQLGISRTPTHDALRKLAADGLVELAATGRCRVAEFSSDDIFDAIEVRKYLEGAAAELAAGRMDERQLTPLRRAITDSITELEDVGRVSNWDETDREFHLAIANASGYRRLAIEIDRYTMLHPIISRFQGPKSVARSLDEHTEILAAISARDAKRARSAATAHLETQQAEVISYGRKSGR